MKQPCITYNTALYMRLSRDDESFGDSVSIGTQRNLLRKYAEDNNLTVFDEYVDDGWTGTSYERPAFQRMIEDIKSGKVNCVVTKDLSRFGREHITMDYYLEYMFPEYHVRYIAVTDNEDTDKGLSDFVPFKNLFNEWYAKDTSRKIKAALHSKFVAGEHTCPFPPLGYKKDETNKNRLVPDEETRWIIEKIFCLADSGYGAKSITKRLIEEQIPTPRYTLYRKYGAYASIYSTDDSLKYLWNIKHVQQILRSRTYVGDTVHYRQTAISYKNKKKIDNSPDKWLVIPNTHDAIISEDVFNSVQKKISARHRNCKTSEPHIFAGLVRCADCGRTMSLKPHQSGCKRFICETYSEYGRTDLTCTSHYIRYDALYSYILSRIKYWAKRSMTEDFVAELMSEKNIPGHDSAAQRDGEINRIKNRLTELERLLAALYEDRISGKLTEANFDLLSSKYQSEQETLERKAENIRPAADAERKKESDAENWASLVRRYVNVTELSRELLNALIEKIVIHEAVRTDTSREQEIEIYYRFVGKLE